MIARIARSGWGPDPEVGLEMIRERALPVLRAQPGYRGLVVVEDSATAEMTFTTYWATQAEMAASDTALVDLRTEVLSEAQLTDLRVEVYEVAATARQHRPVQGTWVRVLEMSCDDDKVEAAITHFRDRVIPALEATAGFVSTVHFVQRTTGRAVVASVWESGEAMLLSASRLGHLREEARVEFGTRIRRVWHARLLLADLRVAVPARI
jgi:heme-degrading monooxygenase HmoA